MAVALLALTLAPPARATTINFDSYSPGTVLNTVSGATFVGSPTVFMPQHVATHSSPNALHTPRPCAEAPSTCGIQEVDFESPQSSVSMYIGLDDEFSSELPVPYQLTAYRLDGTRAAASNGAATLEGGAYQPITSLVSVNSAAVDIARVVISVGRTDVYESEQPRRVNLDDLTFSNGVPTPPEPPSVTIYSPSPGQTFYRTGEVLLSGHVNAPGGVSRFCVTTSTALSIPSTCNQSGYIDSAGNFTRVPVSGLQPGAANTITAWIEDGAEQDRSASVTVNIPSINLSASNLEVSQDVQSQLPSVTAPAGMERTAAYNGVPLAAGHPTIVRFWFGAQIAGLGEPLTGVPAALYGFRDGRSLGPPLMPLEGSRTITNADSVSPTVSLAQWSSATTAYTFRLPDSWASGTVTLQAVINPPGFTPAVTECSGCGTDNSITLSGVGFTPVSTETITPIQMIRADPAHPGSYLYPAENLSGLVIMPFNVNVLPYAGQIDISDGDAFPSDRNKRQDLAMGKLFSIADHRAEPFAGHALAISDGQDLGLTLQSLVCCDRIAVETYAQTEDTRPLTSVMHEFGHEVGLSHAGHGCGGNGQTWPMGDSGLLLGVGLDPRPGSGGRGAPVRVLGEVDGAGNATSFFDFMSYCADANESPSPTNTPNAWISTTYWTTLLEHHATGAAAALASPAGGSNAAAAIGATSGAAGRASTLPSAHAMASAARSPSAIRVTALIGRGVNGILNVEPAPGRLSIPGKGSTVHLRAIDARGRIIADTPVATTSGHMDPGPAFEVVHAVVRGGKGARLQLLDHGRVIAALVRPRHPPKVSILFPRRRTRIPSRGSLLVRWRVRADHRTTSSIDYSADGGRHWNALVAGIRGRSYRLPVSLLSASRRGRLRVRVSDGWNEAMTTTTLARIGPARPKVAILEPLPGAAVAADATLTLRARAYEATQPVDGAQLRWYAGAHYLGSGADISVWGLAAGTDRVRVVAGSGRAQSVASVPVDVRPVVPMLSELRVPAIASPRARRLPLEIASTARSTLAAGGRRFQLDAWPRTVAVPIEPGRSPLRLTLRVGDGRGALVVHRTVRRG